MSARAEFAYVQARLQARHSLRPPETLWRRLEASKDLGHYLRLARGTRPLQRWVAHLSPRTDSHGIERALRREWREYVTEVAAWPPREWAPAVAWTALVVDLPAIAHCLAGRPIPGWMREDPALQPFALDEPSARAEALADSRWGSLIDVDRDPADLPGMWTNRWRRLWPDGEGRSPGLERLVAAVREHLTAMRARIEGGAEAGEALRRALDARICRMFRRHVQSPVALFCHLVLVALDLERLRGGLVRLSLFGRTPPDARGEDDPEPE